MAVRIIPIDEPNSYWLAQIVSDLDDNERLLIAVNGKIVLESHGYHVDLWEGWAEERDPHIELFGDMGGLPNPGYTEE